jgi:hypothetical protein
VNRSRCKKSDCLVSGRFQSSVWLISPTHHET